MGGSWATGAETCLVIYPRELMPDWAERKSSVVFYCPNVSETVDRLSERGVKIAMQPGDLPWGTFPAIEDLDGNWLGLTDQKIVYGPE